MTDPLQPPEPEPASRRVSVELLALIAVLLGAVLVVVGAWSFDWRAGLVALGAALLGGGWLLGSEGV